MFLSPFTVFVESNLYFKSLRTNSSCWDLCPHDYIVIGQQRAILNLRRSAMVKFLTSCIHHCARDAPARIIRLEFIQEGGIDYEIAASIRKHHCVNTRQRNEEIRC